MIRRFALMIVIAFVPAGALAEPLVISLSTDRVEIASNFTGTGLTVFGAVDTRTVELNGGSGIIVVLNGPSETVTTRRKERILGLWLNRSEETFVDVPAFYALHSSAPLDRVAAVPVYEGLRLGLDQIAVQEPDVDRVFAEAFVRLRAEAGHYYERNDAVEFLGSNAFRTVFTLPADVPVGDYRVTVFLFQEGNVIDVANQTLVISKSGAEEFVHTASQDYSWAYALAVIFIAMGAGWLGGVIFRRD